MSGAVQAGERAAMEVLYRRDPDLLTSEDTAIAKLFLEKNNVNMNHSTKNKTSLASFIVVIGIAVAGYFSIQKIRSTNS